MDEEYAEFDVKTDEPIFELGKELDGNVTTSETVLGNNKYWFAAWVTFCIFFSVWFFKKVVRGRQQLRHNFDAIEKELKRIQTIMDSQSSADASTELVVKETTGKANSDEEVVSPENIANDVKEVLQQLNENVKKDQ